MPWEKVTVDTLVNVKDDNRESIGNLLALFDKIMCLFNDMKAEAIKLEQSLISLKATVDTEGEVSDASISTYNSLICQFANVLRLYLAMKVSNESGIASFIIKPVTDIYTDTPYECMNRTSSYSLSFKLPEYNWINCARTCIIDNMSVGRCLPCPCEPFTLDVNIGCSTVKIDLVVQECDYRPSYPEFCKLLCETTPDKLHRLIAHFNKNMTLISKCIDHINHLVSLFELL